MAESGVREDLLSFLPTPARVYIESVLLGEKSPITAEDFTPAELEAIKQVILLSVEAVEENLGGPRHSDVVASELEKLEARQSFANKAEKQWEDEPARRVLPRTPGVVDYETYRKSKATGGDDVRSFGLGALLSTLGGVKHTLGQFNYFPDDEGNVVVEDDYDFSEYFPKGEGMSARRVAAAIGSLGYSELRELAATQLPEGTGRDVNVVLPRDMFSLEELEALFGTKKKQSAMLRN